MAQYTLTNEQARSFVLRWQGLAGPHRFAGAQGVLDYVRQAGCVQYDPVDVCGKSPEITLFARVRGFKKPMLDRLRYDDRALVEYWDKNISLFLAEDWPCFERNREYFRNWRYIENMREPLEVGLEKARAMLGQGGAVCSQDMGLNEKIPWPWGSANLAKAALEYLYYIGEVAVHHRSGTRRWYAQAGRLLPAGLCAQADPNPGDDAYFAWFVRRRIGAKGLLWNRPSDAFLAVVDCKAPQRNAAFESLAKKGDILECRVEDISHSLYCPAAAQLLLQEVREGARYARRLEFIAPLDNMMWDRRLVKELFGFEYKWEIYTPAAKRRYGHYTLPVLYGNRFAGRIQMQALRAEGRLEVSRFWPEEDFRMTAAFKSKLEKRLAQFAAFNGCGQVAWQAGAALGR